MKMLLPCLALLAIASASHAAQRTYTCDAPTSNTDGTALVLPLTFRWQVTWGTNVGVYISGTNSTVSASIFGCGSVMAQCVSGDGVTSDWSAALADCGGKPNSPTNVVRK